MRDLKVSFAAVTIVFVGLIIEYNIIDWLTNA